MLVSIWILSALSIEYTDSTSEEGLDTHPTHTTFSRYDIKLSDGKAPVL